MSKIKALIYCRVSSSQQVVDGHGLDSQEKRCRDYAKIKGYIVDNVFRDEAVSGGLFERPAMSKLLQYADTNAHQEFVVIFDDLKRFARDLKVHFKMKSELQARGLHYECLNFRFEDTPEGEFVENIIASTAQYERQSNRRQVIQKQKARLEKGYWPFGGTPFAYKQIKTQEHGMLPIPIEPQASILSDCLEGFAKGILLNQSEMREYLEERNIHGDSRKVSKGLIERVMKVYWFYAGYVEKKEWSVGRTLGKHKPIINQDILQKIEDRLNVRPPRKLCKNKSDIFPLRQLVRCNVCSELLTSSSPTNGSGKKVYRYTCNNTGCKANPKNIKTDLLHNEYIKLLTVISPEKEIIALAEAVAKDIWQKKMGNIDEEKKNRDKNLSLIIQEINKCVDLAIKAKSDLMREKYEHNVETLEIQKNQLESKFDFLNEVDFEGALECVMDFVGTPAKYWEKSDVDFQRKIHGLIFPEGLGYDAKNGFGTVKKALPFNINEALCESKTRKVEMAGVEPASKHEINNHLRV